MARERMIGLVHTEINKLDDAFRDYVGHYVTKKSPEIGASIKCPVCNSVASLITSKIEGCTAIIVCKKCQHFTVYGS